MTGFVENHPLARDLPELKSQIHELKTTDAHFAGDMESYEALDKTIVRIEQGIELRSDDELETLKRRRVHLKDSLYERARIHLQENPTVS